MAGEAFKLNRCIPLGLELQAVRADERISFSPGSSNSFLSLQRNLHLLFLLYWMTPLIRLVRYGSGERAWKAALKSQILTIRCASPGKRKSKLGPDRNMAIFL